MPQAPGYSAPVAATDLEDFARRFFESHARGDRDAAAAMLAPDVEAYITNADAGIDAVRGRDEYMERVPDLQAAGGSVDTTQVVAVDDERVLTMVEIRAQRGERTLHNFAAFLARVLSEQIVDLWMVDAKPAYSDEFWS